MDGISSVVRAAETGSGSALTPQELEQLRTTRDLYLEKLTDPTNGYALAGVFPMPADLPALYEQLSLLKRCLDSFRPLDSAQVESLQKALDIEYTYNSNRIEGNTLTLRETAMIINEGFTIAGKSMREHLEATNHQEAIALMRDLAGRNEDVTDRNVRAIHAIIMHGINRAAGGAYRREQVFIAGSQHIPPHHDRVYDLMQAMYAFYDASKATMHPVELAAQMHEKLVTIHPFIDGNGRTARLLMNLILLRNGYPVTIISGEQKPRQTYYDTLEAANLSATSDNSAFQRFIAENVHHWLLRYLELVSSDVSLDAKDKGAEFFKTIAPSLGVAR